ncbi:3 exoribonuclease family protein [Niveomyces insectorum RCEF 264]|uniref:Ribosomal RNA-processing protein 43 n=1 Tax=Niveomyces insectorum RCEF 264 TaxID=1081102 RepID=A0A167UIE8_9HYPO|nr:3 exoribonuclease family protein [Niveomyces insectorum RCEF 264]
MSRQKGQLARPVFAKIAPHEFLVANLVRAPTTAEDDANDANDDRGTTQQGTRPNGRTPDEARPFDIHTGALSQAHGSAAVRLGRTRVICGVRGEILPVANIPHYRPSPAAPATATGADLAAADADNRRQLRDYDLLVPNLELATGSAPEFLPGGPPSMLAQVLSTRLFTLLHSSGLVDAESLKIWHQPRRGRSERAAEEGNMDVDSDDVDEDDEIENGDAGEDRLDDTPDLKAYWTLYIDLVFLSFDGNPFDAAWAAVVAALRDTRLPHARWDADRGRVVCAASTPPPLALTLRGLPVALTALVCVANKRKQQQSSDSNKNSGADTGALHWILQDPDRLEESQCRETVTVVVDCSGKAQGGRAGGGGGGGGDGATVIRALSKSGGVLVGPEAMHALVTAAEQRWVALSEALTRQV